MGYFFHFSILQPAKYAELYSPIQISYLNFKAVLVLPKMARSAQTHRNISFIWIFWSTLYAYLWIQFENNNALSERNHPIVVQLIVGMQATPFVDLHF